MLMIGGFLVNLFLSIFIVKVVRAKKGRLILYAIPVAFGCLIEAIAAFFSDRAFSLTGAAMVGIMPLALGWFHVVFVDEPEEKKRKEKK